jgi:aminopeptidase-like protein
VTESKYNLGESIYALASRLWPINRSIMGEGVRETLRIVKEFLPSLSIHEVPSGSQVFDWTIPNEWHVREAWIEGPDGRRVVDFSVNNLHLVSYSAPTNITLDLEELQAHLHSIPEQPEAIPYITSYYSSRWGFCLSHRNRLSLKPGNYRVYIDATLAPGSLSYGELVIPGATAQEVFLSTYVCHPSMANNELSGPCVATYLAKWLETLPNRRYTYRIIFIPETIGSITYLSRNLAQLKQNVIAGFNITCVGDDQCYSYLPSRAGDTLSDRAALHVLKYFAPSFKQYSYLDRGSDERQYCAPGIDLPVASIMRSKYSEYPEYHTSLDDLSLISPKGLEGGFTALRLAIEVIENNCKPIATMLGEPHLGKRGLYPTLGTKYISEEVRLMMDLLAYSDGTHTLLDIANIIKAPMWKLLPILNRLNECDLLQNLVSSEAAVSQTHFASPKSCGGSGCKGLPKTL